MKKIKINTMTFLDNIKEIDERDIEGTITNNVITYFEQNKTKVSLTIKKDIVKLIRENNEYIISIGFSKGKLTKSSIFLKEKGTVYQEVKTKEVLIKPNKIEIKYEIENQNIEYYLNYKEV